MDEKLHQILKTNIEKLRSLISQFPTIEVGWWVVTMAGPLSMEDRFEILSSPWKQSYYLLGLMLSTSEPQKTRRVKQSEWQNAIRLLQAIFSSYGDMFFTNDELFAYESEDRIKHHEVSMQAFLHYFNTDRTHASIEQRIHYILELFQPFNNALSQSFGISAEKAVEITQWIGLRSQEELDKSLSAISVLRVCNKTQNSGIF